ncbi:MAG TPA: hypothetical protein VFF52_16495, partial [Isosphaeraceae bacterium]|nr:hypothetical protein [Isosphaeraceae bacterium]
SRSSLVQRLRVESLGEPQRERAELYVDLLRHDCWSGPQLIASSPTEVDQFIFLGNSWSSAGSLGTASGIGVSPIATSAVGFSNADEYVFVIGPNGIVYTDQYNYSASEWKGWVRVS